LQISTNKNNVIEIFQEMALPNTTWLLYEVAVLAEEESAVCEIYGSKFLRVTDEPSKDFGKLILTADWCSAAW